MPVFINLGKIEILTGKGVLTFVDVTYEYNRIRRMCVLLMTIINLLILSFIYHFLK